MEKAKGASRLTSDGGKLVISGAACSRAFRTSMGTRENASGIGRSIMVVGRPVIVEACRVVV